MISTNIISESCLANGHQGSMLMNANSCKKCMPEVFELKSVSHVIVDEISMVTPSNCQHGKMLPYYGFATLFVGDCHQFPSIGLLKTNS